MATSDAFGAEWDGDSNVNAGAEIVKRAVTFAEAPKPEPIRNQADGGAHSGKEGKHGDPKSTHDNRQAVARGNPHDPNRGRDAVKAMFGGGAWTSVAGGPVGLGGEMRAALGQLHGREYGDARGTIDGLGFKDDGDGGGGELQTIGKLPIPGHGSCVGRNCEVGIGRMDKLHPTFVPPGVSGEPPTIVGYDRELLRQVIKRNISQIRYCYESQLNAHPDLAGKVSVRFVFGPTGRVSAADVALSTADNRGLESCVTEHIRSWVFPAPKGGEVIVTYPFVFTSH